MPDQRFVFGPFVFDARRGLLHKQGSPVPIGQRGLALLHALLKAGGDVVTRSELMDAAWPNVTWRPSNAFATPFA